MSDKLPRRRNLESLKKEAKRWRDALRAGDTDARARLERAVPGAPVTPTLREMQHGRAARGVVVRAVEDRVAPVAAQEARSDVIDVRADEHDLLGQIAAADHGEDVR